MNLKVLLLATLFLMFGIEKALKREEGKKPFNLFLFTGVILFLMLGIEFMWYWIEVNFLSTV
ncbi:hypothetical protein [Guptibacillus algicola]|uniref:hypothetical protein n=1 Tax=Guptibacillus algicola TaxID=225844 RepID=UPI001CD6BD22|nr:hypothetical protein [Alkalihalobacillus algicola]MCA0987139.1 hypothetical protein [Alkalihalobacillus algicola]